MAKQTFTEDDFYKEPMTNKDRAVEIVDKLCFQAGGFTSVDVIDALISAGIIKEELDERKLYEFMLRSEEKEFLDEHGPLLRFLAKAICSHFIRPEKNQEILKKYERLTPQGSEFADEPETVYQYLSERLGKYHEVMKTNVLLKRKLRELPELDEEKIVEHLKQTVFEQLKGKALLGEKINGYYEIWEMVAHAICSKFGKPEIKLPKKKKVIKNAEETIYGWKFEKGWNACLDEIKRLNKGE